MTEPITDRRLSEFERARMQMLEARLQQFDDGLRRIEASRYRQVGVLALTFLALVLVGGLLWLAFFEPPYLSYPGLPLRVMNPERKVAAGEKITIAVVRCNASGRTRVYPISREMRSQDGRVINLEARLVGAQSGCSETESIWAMPAVPPGMYTLHGSAEISGLIRAHSIPWFTEQFEVVNAP